MSAYRFEEFGQYKTRDTLTPFRPQHPVIVSWVKRGAKVLDIGCGDGVLGEKLIQEKNCSVYGIDLDATGVKEAKRRGIKSRVFDANKALPFPRASFDVVICNELLEFIKRPDVLVSECLRIGNVAIIEFPNFGFWFYRLQLLFGRFPSLALYGYQWSNTHQIKFFSYTDFLDLPATKRAVILRTAGIDWQNRHTSLLASTFPNFFARSVLLQMTSKTRAAKS